MIRLTSPVGAPPDARGALLALGNFDGVHRGHQAVLAFTRARAAALGAPAGVLTFEPHPRAFFRPDDPPFRLTPSPVRATLLESAGADVLIELPFDAALAGTSAEDFVAGMLVGQLGVRGVVAGHDFHFGRARAGTPAFLAEAGARLGFEVDIVEPERLLGETVSSSLVRQALAGGDIARASDLLGREWFVRGPVVHGAKRGRTLGYPTANTALDPSCRLRHGVYAVRATVGGVTRPAVASFGSRPQFDDGPPLLETFLFDFSGDLYGQDLEVAFVAFLRPEARFESVEALVRQMDDDSAQARVLLAK